MGRIALLNGTRALLAALLLSSCGGGSPWWQTLQWEDYTFESLPQGEAFPGEGAVILLDEGRMETFGSGVLGYSVFEQHRIVRVFDVRGERHANIVLPYGSSSEIDEIQARTITSSGAVVPLRKEDVHDVSLYPNFVFFSDQRARIFTMPAVEPGAVLEYRYRIKVRNRTVWHGWRFQSDAPTLISRFTLVAPAEWPISFRTYGIELEPEIERLPSGFKSTFQWEARNIPGLDAEPGMPPASERLARLAIAPLGFSSWDDVSSWYHKLSEPRARDDDGIPDLVDSLTAGTSDNDTKMRILYEWVRDHVRYLAVEIGIGGYQPHPSGEICTNRYGDCKDMATLLTAMADAAGIDVQQVLISTWQNGLPDTTLPSPFHFNHAITYAPTIRGGLWMDATSKGTPYGELPWYNQGVPALVVQDNGESSLLMTAKSAPEANRERVRWTVSLDDTGGAHVRARTMLTGALALEAWDDLAYRSEQEREHWIEQGLPPDYSSGAVLEGSSIDGLDPVGDSLAWEAVFSTPAFAARDADALRFRPGMITASGLPDLFRPGPRAHPIRFRFGLRRELHLDLTFPKGWGASSPPLADSMVTPFGWWRSELQPTADGVRFWRVVQLESREVDPEMYPQYQQFLDALRRSELRTVVLRRVLSHATVREPGDAHPEPGPADLPAHGVSQPAAPLYATPAAVSSM